jgi:MerR family transcriptional regulator, thiopeptide resistance regulator
MAMTDLSVKQLAKLAGVSVRTLHYYDQIGLLRPGRRSGNGYRRYSQAAVLRLQQILFYKELGLSLEDIGAALERPDFNLLSALQAHRAALQQRVGRLQRLIDTVDLTIAHLRGDSPMMNDDLFAGFSQAQQEAYEQEAYEMWGETVRQTSQRWKAYSAEDRARILNEAAAIYRDFAAHLDHPPASPAVQAVAGRWHQNLRNFFEPTTDVLRGLGQTYSSQPEIIAFFERLDARLPAFLTEAIVVYCDR